MKINFNLTESQRLKLTTQGNSNGDLETVNADEQIQEFSHDNSTDYSSLPYYSTYVPTQDLTESVQSDTTCENNSVERQIDTADEFDKYYTDEEGNQLPKKSIGGILTDILLHPITLAIKTIGSLIALLLN